MSWLLLTAAVVMFSIQTVQATDKALVVMFSENHSFTFRPEHLQRLQDCLCQEDNTACIFIYTPAVSVEGIQGPKIDWQGQTRAFFECQFHANKIVNVTCTRTIPSRIKSECINCFPICFNNTSPCDVSILFKSQRNVTVNINDYIMHRGQCEWPTTAAQTSHNTSSHLAKTTSIYVLICLGIYFSFVVNILDNLV